MRDFFSVVVVFVIFWWIVLVFIRVFFCFVSFLVLVWIDWLSVRILVVREIVLLWIFCNFLIEFRNFLCLVRLICLMLVFLLVEYWFRYWIKDWVWFVFVVFLRIGISWLRKLELVEERMIWIKVKYFIGNIFWGLIMFCGLYLRDGGVIVIGSGSVLWYFVVVVFKVDKMFSLWFVGILEFGLLRLKVCELELVLWGICLVVFL